jgi:hypothetical protein
MKKIIDLDEKTAKKLKHLAVDAGMDLKNYIQKILKDFPDKSNKRLV